MLSSGNEEQKHGDKKSTQKAGNLTHADSPSDVVVEPLHSNLPRPNFKNPLLQKKSDKPK